jgi:RimJ/RimL family protein N-acetyltransferase
MYIELPQCIVRPWRKADKASLIRYANNRKVWRNLTYAFPHPYGESDADSWLSLVSALNPSPHCAIEVAGEAVGGIGVTPLEGIFARTGEFGYWLGEPFWSRGIMTAAATAVVPLVLSEFQLYRLEAAVFDWNPASMRVLEKVGFVREGILRQSVLKDGQVIDRVLYAYVRDV